MNRDSYGWLGYVAVLLILAILALTYYGIKSADEQNDVKGIACTQICMSHDYNYKKTGIAYQENPVCYCTDNESAIWTFTMSSETVK